MQCKQCDTDVESMGTKPKLFCSDACRKRYKRTQQTDTVTNGHPHRPAIPGDPDYSGVCKFIDGEWVVKPDVVDISSLSDVELQLRLKSYRGASWVGSPEHKEVIKRKLQEVAC